MVNPNAHVIPGTRLNTNFGRGGHAPFRGAHVPVGRRNNTSYTPSVSSSRMSSVFQSSHVVPGTRKDYSTTYVPTHHTTTYVPTSTTRSYSYLGGGGGFAAILTISLIALGFLALFPLLLI